MPYLTPEEIPEDDDCRPLSIPADSNWLAIVSGALTELTKKYNWQQFGSVTVDEAVARMQEMVDAYYAGGCEDCALPEGEGILRLDDEGHIQQLIDGEWTEPTGDYTIPSVPEREDPTPEERRCLAAANAENVLAQLYEEVSDSVVAGASELEALAVLVGAATSVVGSWLGFAVAPLVALALGLFKSFLSIAIFMTEDLWDTEFSDRLRCILYDCSLDTAGVVTFDFNCVIERMAAYTEILDLNFVNNVRLFGQVHFLLSVIGVDGLNLAGATTDIDTADCDDCPQEWCYRWFGATFVQGDWEMETYVYTTPTTYDGVKVVGGFQTTPTPTYANIAQITYPGFTGNMTYIGFELNFKRTGGAAPNYAVLYINGVDVAHSPNLNGEGIALISWAGTVDDPSSIELLGGVEDTVSHTGYFYIKSCTARGEGVNPIDANNCI